MALPYAWRVVPADPVRARAAAGGWPWSTRRPRGPPGCAGCYHPPASAYQIEPPGTPRYR